MAPIMLNLAGITRSGRNPFSNPKKVNHSPLVIQNKIHFDVVGPNEAGEIVTKQSVRDVENLMVSYGLIQAAKLISTSTKAGSTYAATMAIGTSTAAAATTQDGLSASTQLCGTFTPNDAGAQTARYLATFASNGNACSVQEIGIFASNVASASMICRSVLTGTQSVNRGASDQINVSYDILATTA